MELTDPFFVAGIIAILFLGVVIGVVWNDLNREKVCYAWWINTLITECVPIAGEDGVFLTLQCDDIIVHFEKLVGGGGEVNASA